MFMMIMFLCYLSFCLLCKCAQTLGNYRIAPYKLATEKSMNTCTLTAISILALLFAVHFQSANKENFVQKSRASLIDDEFLYFCDLNPLTPESDQHIISPYNITPESHIRLTRIKEIITNYRGSLFLNKFSLSAPWKTYGEQYGEYAY